jgi:hypothetical protein
MTWVSVETTTAKHTVEFHLEQQNISMALAHLQPLTARDTAASIAANIRGTLIHKEACWSQTKETRSNVNILHHSKALALDR